MANADAAFGLRPLGLNTDKQTSVYSVDATSASAIYINDPVTMTGSADANGIPEVGPITVDDATPANNSPIVGIVVGVASDKTGGQLQDDNKYVSATPGAGKYVIVADDPDLTFAVQEDGDLGVAGVGAHFNLEIAAGNNTSGVSKTEIDSSTADVTDAAGEYNLKVMRLRQSPDNEVGTNAVWECRFVNHQLRGEVNRAV